MPHHDFIVSDPAAFLHGYAYVYTTASVEEAR
jgi:hypothetical protein